MMFSFLFKNVKIANRIYIYFCKGLFECVRARTPKMVVCAQWRAHIRAIKSILTNREIYGREQIYLTNVDSDALVSV